MSDWIWLNMSEGGEGGRSGWKVVELLPRFSTSIEVLRNNWILFKKLEVQVS